MSCKPLSRVPILACSSTDEYAKTVPYLVNKEDIVLEVGCAQGETTSIISKFASQVIGIDISTECITMAQKKHPQIQFILLDVNKMNEEFTKLYKFTKIYIDIGGIAPLTMVSPVIKLVQKTWKPKLIVIKSFPLVQLQHQLGLGNKLFDEIKGNQILSSTRTGQFEGQLKELTHGIKVMLEDNEYQYIMKEITPFPFPPGIKISTSVESRAKICGIGGEYLLKSTFCTRSDHTQIVIILSNMISKIQIEKFSATLSQSHSSSIQFNRCTFKDLRQKSKFVSKLVNNGFFMPFGPHLDQLPHVVMISAEFSQTPSVLIEIDYGKYLELSGKTLCEITKAIICVVE